MSFDAKYLKWSENTTISGYHGSTFSKEGYITITSYIKVNPGDTVSVNSDNYEFLLYGYSDVGDGYYPNQYIDVNPKTSSIWGNFYTFKEKFVYQNGKVGSYPLYVRIVVKPITPEKLSGDFNASKLEKLFSFNITADNSHLIPDNKSVIPSPLFESRETTLIAHRGKSTAPENTIEALKEAYKDGIRAFEVDIQVTSDGVPVLLHDATIDRTSNGTGYIKHLTYDEAVQYDYNAGKAEYKNITLPKLADFLQWCKKNDCLCELDVADRGFTFNEINAIYNTVKAADALDSAIFTATPKELNQYMLINENLIISVSAIWNIDDAKSLLENKWKNCALVFASMPIGYSTQEIVDYVRSLGRNMRTKMWTINRENKDMLKKALNIGADAILTENMLYDDLEETIHIK